MICSWIAATPFAGADQPDQLVPAVPLAHQRAPRVLLQNGKKFNVKMPIFWGSSIDLMDLVNPFPTNPSVCGMGGGRFGPPIISQPLKGLEG